MPSHVGRHRRGSSRRGTSALLTLLATLSILLGSAIAAVSLDAHEPTSPPPPTGNAALGQAAGGTAAIGTAPAPSSTSPDPRSRPSSSRGDRPEPTDDAGATAQPSPATHDDPSAGANGNETSDGGHSSHGQSSGADQQVASLEEQVLAVTNAERAAAGCGALDMDDRLRSAARGHSQDMAARDYFSHTTPEGASPSDRARAAGWPGGAGENIAMGYRSPEAVMDGWMNSDGHRANLLNCRYTDIGVGVASDDRGRLYWTQKFGTQR